MTEYLEIAAAISLFIGGFFTLVGSIGLLKVDTPMSRLHAPTKASTLGVGSLLLGSMLAAFARGEGWLHQVLILAFLFVTAPITANFIAKVHLHGRSSQKSPPPPPTGGRWATYDTPQDDARKPVEGN